MSNIFKNTAVNYFQIPQSLITGGVLAALLPSTMKMYLVLLFEAQNRSRSDLTLTNSDFARRAGLAPNSVTQGREQLVESGLVQVEKADGGRFRYVLCDPATKQPFAARKS